MSDDIYLAEGTTWIGDSKTLKPTVYVISLSMSIGCKPSYSKSLLNVQVREVGVVDDLSKSSSYAESVGHRSVFNLSVLKLPDSTELKSSGSHAESSFAFDEVNNP